MTSTLHLRDYQQEAIAALEKGWETQQRLGISLPTGVGKTIIMAHLAHRHAQQRVLITVHRDELVTQTVDKLRRVDPLMSIGVVKASRNQGGAAVVVASIQTISKPNRLAQIGRFGLIIVDEAHRSMSPSYQSVLTTLDAPRVAGFTATWSRSDSKGLGDYWQDIVFTRSIKWAVANGHLVKPIGKRIITDLDLSKVTKTAGDYSDKSLGTALTESSIRDAIILAYKTHAADRQGALFAPTVASAEYFAEGLTAAGFPTEGLFGKTGTQESADVHRRFREGRTQILATCTRLAEGWDAPWCSVGVIARPTLHKGLFIQMAGRVFRPWPGKHDALILDVAGATDRHDLNAFNDLSTSPEPRKTEDFDLEDELDLDREEREEAIKHDAQVVGFDDVDLFAGSPARWQVSAQGIQFVRTQQHLYFLWPNVDGSWAVGRCPANSLFGGQWLKTDCDAESALLWAGQLAVEEDPSTADKKAKWRTNIRPSVRQVEYANSLGIVVPPGCTRGQISDMIDHNLASRVLAGLGT